MAVERDSTEDGVAVHQWGRPSPSSSEWYPTKFQNSPATFWVTNLGSSKDLTVRGGNGAVMHQFWRDGTTSFQWEFHEVYGSRMPTCKKSHCNVVVVVDMQNDYCHASGPSRENECQAEQDPFTGEMYEPGKSPFTVAGVKDAGNKVNEVMDSVDADVVVFTQDWLSPDDKFLRENTFGTRLLSNIRQPLDKSYRFTKSTDDWMIQSFVQGERKYALNGKQIGLRTDVESTTLPTIFETYGYDEPGKTTMYVTGVALNRCVYNACPGTGLRGVLVRTGCRQTHAFEPCQGQRSRSLEAHQLQGSDSTCQ